MNYFTILMVKKYNIGISKQQLVKKIYSTGFGDREPATEWAQIAPGKVVVAIADRAWLYHPISRDDRFAQPMSCLGHIATTRGLLDTAIAVAQHTTKSDLRPPALTPTRWIWRLASAYHLTSRAYELMKNAAKSFAANGHSDLEAWALEKAEEEKGHERLALLDIQSLGYDAAAVVQELVPPAAMALMDYFSRSAQDSNPIDCVGYVYTMERLSLGIGEEYIQKIEALLPSDVKATRCLRVHSAVGADAEHVDENVALVAKLDSAERTRIARACYETALICFSSPPVGYISNQELEQILRPLKLN
ncbi:MAG: iron-containing redox enzyme family protein [Cyanobacteria bacterium P01_F01_bin.143]